jgi:hypothetical protein
MLGEVLKSGVCLSVAFDRFCDNNKKKKRENVTCAAYPTLRKPVPPSRTARLVVSLDSLLACSVRWEIKTNTLSSSLTYGRVGHGGMNWGVVVEANSFANISDMHR